jgi:hypothetical protein
MADLADYVADFAALLGSKSEVRFAGVVNQSVSIRANVPPPSVTDARHRLTSASTDPDSEWGKVYTLLARKLARDNLTASVLDAEGARIIDFPRPATPPTEPITIRESSVLDGTVVAVRGRDETVHVTILDIDGRTFSAETRDFGMAQELAQRFRGRAVRLRVDGTWTRSPEGQWALTRGRIESFEDLDETPLAAIVGRLPEVVTEEFMRSQDPLAEWREMRS